MGRIPPSDPDDLAEDSDLWFLPGPVEDDPHLPPLPRADRRDLLATAEWRRAEAELAPDLARAAQLFGALDERLRHAPAGHRQRLALLEAAEFSWWSGDRVSADRLAQWLVLRLDGVQDDPLALARAGWALRRLSGGPGPDTGLAAFLDRPEAERHGEAPRLIDPLADWAEVLDGAEGMHPLTRSAFLFHGWDRIGGGDAAGPGALTEAGRLPMGDHAARIEAAVVAARIGAADGRGGAVFLPLATGGSAALRPGGSPAERVARWYGGAGLAMLAALRLLDRLDDWQRQAGTAIADLSGRTPPRLLSVLAGWPLVSAPLAERETGASRAAVQRNLDQFTRRGLIREVTGQGRFRLWTAKL